MNSSLRPEELEGKALVQNNERVDLRASAEHGHVQPASEFYRQRELARAAEMVDVASKNGGASEYATSNADQLKEMLDWISRAGGVIEYARNAELADRQ